MSEHLPFVKCFLSGLLIGSRSRLKTPYAGAFDCLIEAIEHRLMCGNFFVAGDDLAPF